MIYRQRSIILDMGKIGDRLEELRKEKGLNKAEMARLGATSKQRYGRISLGQIDEPGPSSLALWAKAFNVRMEWIATGKAPKYLPFPADTIAANDDLKDWDPVLAYAQAVGLGDGPEAQEYAKVNKLLFRHDSLAKKRLHAQNLRVMFGAGDSMEPTIRNDDAIMFDVTETTLKNKGIYVVLIPGAGAEEYNVKRYLSKDGGVFVADNPEGDHSWKAPRPAEGIKVIGRARWTGGWLK